MRKDLRWGFALPYLLTGMLNQHPRSAIKYNEAPDPGDILEFFDSLIDEN
jgi:4-hydroxy 2-oxovalerate aldolase